MPGLGHFLLRRIGRAIVFFIAVGGLALVGYHMRGNVFPRIRPILSAHLDFGRTLRREYSICWRESLNALAPTYREQREYGTRFIAAAGIVNLIATFDAYEIAAGRRG